MTDPIKTNQSKTTTNQIAREQMVAFLVDLMGYDEADLIDLSMDELQDGLNMAEVERFIS